MTEFSRNNFYPNLGLTQDMIAQAVPSALAFLEAASVQPIPERPITPDEDSEVDYIREKSHLTRDVTRPLDYFRGRQPSAMIDDAYVPMKSDNPDL